MKIKGFVPYSKDGSFYPQYFGHTLNEAERNARGHQIVVGCFPAEMVVESTPVNDEWLIANDYFQCVRCLQWFDNDESRRGKDGELRCESCHIDSEVNVQDCPKCGESCNDDQTIDDHGMCYDCFHSHENGHLLICPYCESNDYYSEGDWYICNNCDRQFSED